MILYDINNVELFEGCTQAQRIANKVFDDDFTTCIDKTITELEVNFKSYLMVTLAQGQILHTSFDSIQGLADHYHYAIFHHNLYMYTYFL